MLGSAEEVKGEQEQQDREGISICKSSHGSKDEAGRHGEGYAGVQGGDGIGQLAD